MSVCSLHPRDPLHSPTHKQDRISNPSLCEIVVEAALPERTVGLIPVVLIERLSDSWTDSVVVDHVVVPARAGLEL